MWFCFCCDVLVEFENIVEVKNEGFQFLLYLKCVNNCEYKWQLQFLFVDIKGVGNLFFIIGIYFFGIFFFKFEFFLKFINLKFFGEGIYFILR